MKEIEKRMMVTGGGDEKAAGWLSLSLAVYESGLGRKGRQGYKNGFWIFGQTGKVGFCSLSAEQIRSNKNNM